MKKLLSILSVVVISMVVSVTASAAETLSANYNYHLVIAQSYDVKDEDKDTLDDELIFMPLMHLAYCTRNPNDPRCKDWFGEHFPNPIP